MLAVTFAQRSARILAFMYTREHTSATAPLNTPLVAYPSSAIDGWAPLVFKLTTHQRVQIGLFTCLWLLAAFLCVWPLSRVSEYMGTVLPASRGSKRSHDKRCCLSGSSRQGKKAAAVPRDQFYGRSSGVSSSSGADVRTKAVEQIVAALNKVAGEGGAGPKAGDPSSVANAVEQALFALYGTALTDPLLSMYPQLLPVTPHSAHIQDWFSSEGCLSSGNGKDVHSVGLYNADGKDRNFHSRVSHCTLEIQEALRLERSSKTFALQR